MGLRPGRTIRKLERPWTRVSQTKPRKSYVVGVPFPKTHQFEMGVKGDYDTVINLLSRNAIQVRDNALEAARIVATRFLETKLPNAFFMKLLVYPHHVIREKPIATGAGADRYSQGMAHPFGKPTGKAVQLKRDQAILQLRINKASIPVAKVALKKFGLKMPTATRIVVES